MRIPSLAALLFTATIAAAAPPVVHELEPDHGYTYAYTLVYIDGENFTDEFIVHCSVGPCPVRVYLGDVEQRVVEVRPNRILFLAAPRTAGAVDVRVVTSEGETLSRNAFRYDQHATPGTLNMKPYLVPLGTGQVPGANGSLWSTELTVFNRAAHPAVLTGGVFHPFILDPPPVTPVVEPGETESVEVYAVNSDGAFLWVARPLADNVHFSLRVRDVSKNAQSWGTAIPLVPHEDFHDMVRLIDIPTDSRYRATLRIYHWAASGPQSVQVRIYVPGQTEPALQFEAGSSAPLPNVQTDFAANPATARIDLLTPEVRALGPRIRIEVDNGSPPISPPAPPVWAFVSVTNNETQQVTTITPLPATILPLR